MLSKFDRIYRNGIEEIHVSFVDGETREFKDGPFTIDVEDGTIRIYRLDPETLVHLLSFSLSAVETMVFYNPSKGARS